MQRVKISLGLNCWLDRRQVFPLPCNLSLCYRWIADYRKAKSIIEEGMAREEIIVALLGRGWIRVREYRNYLAVQLLDLGQYDSRHFVTLAM